MPDDTSLGYNGDPNLVNPSNSDGEFLLFYSPNSTRYAEFDALQDVKQEYFKSGQPNIWSKFGADSSAGEINYGVNVGDGDVSIYYQKVGAELQFRELSSGVNITISASDNVIAIDSSGLTTQSYTDASLSAIIVNTDASITSAVIIIDASIDDIRSTYIPDVSLGDSLAWDAGVLDVSIADSSVASSVVVYDPSTLSPTLEMPKDVGGILAGTSVSDLDGDSVTELFNELLFPTVDPSYIEPYNSFTDDTSTPYVVGDNLNIVFTAEFNRGEIAINGVFQDYRAGVPSGYYYTDSSGNTLLNDVVTSSLIHIQTVNGYVVVEGTQTFTNTVQFLEGPQPYDNKDISYEAPLPAGTTTIETLSFEGVYPIYATTVDITTYTLQPLYSMIDSNNIELELVPEVGGKQGFELPAVWVDSRPLIGITTYNLITKTWDYQGGSAALSLLYWDETRYDKSGINYSRRVYNSDNRSTIQIRLVP